MSRFGAMHPCGVGRSTEGNQKAEGQTERIAFAPIDQPPFFCGARAAPPQSVSVPRSLKLGMHNKPCRSRTYAATSKCLAPHFRNWALSRHQVFAKVRFAPTAVARRSIVMECPFDPYACPVAPSEFSQFILFNLQLLSALALSALHHVVARSLSSVDVKNLPGHKLRAIEVEHRVDNVGHISHPTHWMERRQCLVRFWQVHRRLDYSR